MLIFVGQNWKTSIIRKKRNVWIIFLDSADEKWRLDLDSTGQKKLIRISSIQKIPVIPKIQSRYFRMSCNYRNNEKVKNVQNELLLFKVVYFDLQNPNLMSILVSLNRKPSIIRKNKEFPGLSRFSGFNFKKSTFGVQLLIKTHASKSYREQSDMFVSKF